MYNAPPFSFACHEIPTKAVLSSVANGKRLSIRSDGTVSSTHDRKDCEEWILVPTVGTTVLIQSSGHGRFLTSNDDGEVSTTTDQDSSDAKWTISKSPSVSGSDATTASTLTGFCVRSVEHGTALMLCDNGCLQTTRSGENVHAWNFEIRTGELCFLSSAGHDKRIKCGPSGGLQMTENWKGWEVWRFIEVGDGNVFISSWTHDDHYLSSDSEGRVTTTKTRDKWSIKIDPNSSSTGVVIKSVSHGKILHSNGVDLYTAHDREGEAGLWCLETACSQTYFLSSIHHEKRIGASASSVFSTKNRKAWEEWKLEKGEKDNCYTLYCRAHGKYLGSESDGTVSVTSKGELWNIKSSPHGGFFLVSHEHKRFLICNNEGHLRTETEHQQDGWELWNLEPCMPHTISKQQMVRNMAIGVSSAVALALTIAMPFAAVGVVGALGFTEAGIAAGSVGAAMMSAEAIASGGGVAAGGMVATLQSIGVLGLGAAGTSAAVGVGAVVGGSIVASTAAIVGDDAPKQDVENEILGVEEHEHDDLECRPFCEWRSW